MQTSPSRYRIVLCTCPDRVCAERIASALLERRLAACVNVLPGVMSRFWWNGKVDGADEHLLLVKTRVDAFQQIQETITSLHPYELPEVLAVPIADALAPYLRWIDESMEEQP